MLEAPSTTVSPALRVLETRAQAQGAKLLPSGVYQVQGFQVMLLRTPPTSHISPPTLSNLQAVPVDGGIFSEVGRRLGVMNTVSCLGSLLAGRVFGGKRWEDQAPFVIDPAPGASAAKLHIPGVDAVQEIPALQLWQWLELLVRAQLLPWDGKAVYAPPGQLARMLGQKPAPRDGSAPEWVGTLRQHHVQVLAKTGEARLAWADPQPSPLQDG